MTADFPPYDRRHADRVFRWSLLLAAAVHGLLLYRWPIWERTTTSSPPPAVLEVTLASAPRPPTPESATAPPAAQPDWQPPAPPMQTPHPAAPATTTAPLPATAPAPPAKQLRRRFLQAVRVSPWHLTEPPDSQRDEPTIYHRPMVPANAGWMSPLLPAVAPALDLWHAADGTVHKIVVAANGERYCGRGQALNPLEPFHALPMLWHDCGTARGAPAPAGDPWQRPAPQPVATATAPR